MNNRWRTTLTCLIAILIVLAAFWYFRDSSTDRLQVDQARNSNYAYDPAAVDNPAKELTYKLKVKEREGERSATHTPDQLRNFYISGIELDGVTLREALAKAMDAYRDACQVSGEVPLKFTFSVPPEVNQRITAQLPMNRFLATVQSLAALYGTSVKRKDLEFEFTRFSDEQVADAKITVPSDLKSQLAEMTGTVSDDLLEILKSMGVVLSPGVKIQLYGGTLLLENGTSADVGTLSGLAKALEIGPQKFKYTTKVIGVPEGVSDDFLSSLSDSMTSGEIEDFMREAVNTKGVDAMTLPSAVARNANPVTVEISNSQPDGSQTGLWLDLQPDAVGFGGIRLHIDREGEGFATIRVGKFRLY
ncbi:hypothetical protein JIN85_03535 [Luteolibacter pohnpeiensis]|uniref:Uncharacterized protein n=1 Tax=Luteolibacter pohnpeiensis TaxID=454153 RepID=A0A934S867_9BACT|nr:hypothetical protein [Luteolibacter pohnpeiensis]MBK1881472.1 hypothetical protein [Luteolibacter pohnpeiensis]